MSKVLAVAWSEFQNAVRSKAFIIGVLMLPVLWSAMFFVPRLLEGKGDVDDRRFAVVDRTGEIYPVLEAAAAERNETVFEGEGEEARQTEPRFLPELYAAPVDDDGGEEAAEWQLELSDAVRDGELFAFVEIGADVFEGGNVRRTARVNYFTQTPTYGDLPRWIQRTVDNYVRDVRFQRENLDPELVKKLNREVTFRKLGLASRSEEGEVIEAESEEGKEFIPLAGMMLIFMLVMTVAPAGLNNVLEEKMQKISEVLVAAVSPFQLMLGKLLGTVLVAGLLSALYVGAAVSALYRYDVAHYVPTEMYLWFVVFQVLALFIFGSIFSAIGAACSEMRDAQSFMMPVMMLIMLPMFLLQLVMESPNSPISVAASLFPPATPFIMLARIGIPPGPPIWQVLLSAVLTTLFSLFCVWAGSKIFRVGLLAQGQTPSFAKLAKWVFSK